MVQILVNCKMFNNNKSGVIYYTLPKSVFKVGNIKIFPYFQINQLQNFSVILKLEI